MPLRELRNTVTLHQQIKPDSLCIIMASEDPSKLIKSNSVSMAGIFCRRKEFKKNKIRYFIKIKFHVMIISGHQTIMNEIRCFINIKFQLAFVMIISGHRTNINKIIYITSIEIFYGY